ncbi:MAG: hypothetical protein QOI61_147 [Actinomycetota bacterium]|jgi:hypothetical protein
MSRTVKVAIGALLAVVATVVAVVVPTPQSAGAVTAHELTLIGTDFKPLDTAFSAEFLTGTGGGVYPRLRQGYAGDLPAYGWFLEANVDLPPGAKVTEVTFYSCGSNDNKFYFGSYAPASNGFVYHLPAVAAANRTACPTRFTFKRTGNPIATVVVGRRYVLGYRFVGVGDGRATPSNADDILHGATLRYTCATAC